MSTFLRLRREPASSSSPWALGPSKHFCRITGQLELLGLRSLRRRREPASSSSSYVAVSTVQNPQQNTFWNGNSSSMRRASFFEPYAANTANDLVVKMGPSSSSCRRPSSQPMAAQCCTYLGWAHANGTMHSCFTEPAKPQRATGSILIYAGVLSLPERGIIVIVLEHGKQTLSTLKVPGPNTKPVDTSHNSGFRGQQMA